MVTEQIENVANKVESYQTIVIGGGQAGLAAGYFLAHHGDNFLLLDKNLRTGDTWRNHWDGLRLFTPSQFNGLPGMPFPGPVNYLPTKNEVADYLENYAKQFTLPIRYGISVKSVRRNDRGYEIITNGARFQAENVIIATGPFQVPHTPAFSRDLGPEIFQLHSSQYRNPDQVPARSVLVVGAGNSGAEIALELVKAGKQVWLAGRDVGRIPANSPMGKVFNGRPMWWFMGHVLTVNTPVGRKVREAELHHGTPLGRATRGELAAAGVDLVPRVADVRSGQPELEDGRLLPADGVIWATGFRPDYRWVELPIFDEHCLPQHQRGVVRDAPGLYFLGLLFQNALNSSLLGGVGNDAAYIVGQIARKGL